MNEGSLVWERVIWFAISSSEAAWMLEFFDRPDHRLIEKGFGSCVERPLGLVDMRSKRILKNVSSGGFLFLKEIPRSKDKSLEFIGLRWGSIPKISC